ncbi:hypothetical protein [uncultured Chryseobacterium sp.]|uniref:hypothetical protein n=1 Tax=uncultured Chryseobacterium sp. TaxID=259322 RepID=UPI0025DD88D1|nr:hypothetical protein [uncultured Chryseobacterium sp.]
MITYKGIVEDNNLELDLSYIGNILSVEQILIVMKSMSPDFIEINGNIYLKSNFESYGSDNNRFEYSQKGKEKYINTISISDVFYFSSDKETHKKEVQKKIGLYILEFWKIRLNFLLPDKNFEFMLFEDGLYDESGVCITFNQTH